MTCQSCKECRCGKKGDKLNPKPLPTIGNTSVSNKLRNRLETILRASLDLCDKEYRSTYGVPLGSVGKLEVSKILTRLIEEN